MLVYRINGKAAEPGSQNDGGPESLGSQEHSQGHAMGIFLLDGHPRILIITALCSGDKHPTWLPESETTNILTFQFPPVELYIVEFSK